MQGLEIGGNGSTYGPMDAMDVSHEDDLSFEQLGDLQPPPQAQQSPNHDQNSVAAAWYDTDLWTTIRHWQNAYYRIFSFHEAECAFTSSLHILFFKIVQ